MGPSPHPNVAECRAIALAPVEQSQTLTVLPSLSYQLNESPLVMAIIPICVIAVYLLESEVM